MSNKKSNLHALRRLREWNTKSVEELFVSHEVEFVIERQVSTATPSNTMPPRYPTDSQKPQIKPTS